MNRQPCELCGTTKLRAYCRSDTPEYVPLCAYCHRARGMVPTLKALKNYWDGISEEELKYIRVPMRGLTSCATINIYPEPPEWYKNEIHK